jgi:hypothetical protein
VDRVLEETCKGEEGSEALGGVGRGDWGDEVARRGRKGFASVRFRKRKG